jgi:hypothetical protein
MPSILFSLFQVSIIKFVYMAPSTRSNRRCPSDVQDWKQRPWDYWRNDKHCPFQSYTMKLPSYRVQLPLKIDKFLSHGS